MVENLGTVDPELCVRVAATLGLPAPDGAASSSDGASPALSQIAGPGPVVGRIVGVIASEDVDGKGLAALKRGPAGSAVVKVIAERGGVINSGDASIPVDKTLFAVQSVELDAVVVAGSTSEAEALPPIVLSAQHLLQQAFRHGKPVAAWGTGSDGLDMLGIEKAAGVVRARRSNAQFATELLEALGQHRFWARNAGH